MKKEHDFENEQLEETENDTADVMNEEVVAADVSALEEENRKLKEEFLRALAESENVKKRCALEIEKNNKYAIASFAKDLLGVADNLQRALQAASESAGEECQPILKGVELTQAELNHVFAKFGIEAMDIDGTVFDPNFHQVVQEVEDPGKPNGTIVTQLQTGYMINGRILREAMVVVTKGGK